MKSKFRSLLLFWFLNLQREVQNFYEKRVVVLALFMWLVDSGLSWLFYDILLKRG
jgi:hypothetical protein